MKLLVDTNVILDFLLQRDGFYEAARELIIRESESSAELVSASAITDIHYTVVSALKKTGLAETEPEASMNSQQRIAQLLSFVSIVPVNRANIDYALELAWVDFEDAVYCHTGSEGFSGRRYPFCDAYGSLEDYR